jgi:hypothetical protein
MGSPSDLLDELARVYARAAVDAFLARTEDGVVEESPDEAGAAGQPAGRPPTQDAPE